MSDYKQPTCETHGHIYNSAGCVFCKAPPPTPASRTEERREVPGVRIGARIKDGKPEEVFVAAPVQPAEGEHGICMDRGPDGVPCGYPEPCPTHVPVLTTERKRSGAVSREFHLATVEKLSAEADGLRAQLQIAREALLRVNEFADEEFPHLAEIALTALARISKGGSREPR